MRWIFLDTMQLFSNVLNSQSFIFSVLYAATIYGVTILCLLSMILLTYEKAIIQCVHYSDENSEVELYVITST